MSEISESDRENTLANLHTNNTRFNKSVEGIIWQANGSLVVDPELDGAQDQSCGYLPRYARNLRRDCQGEPPAAGAKMIMDLVYE